MNRYWITLPVGFVLMVALIIKILPYREIRRKALVVMSVLYSLGNTYLILQDSYYGLLDAFRQDTSSSMEFKKMFGLPLELLGIFALLMLFALGMGWLLMNLFLNIRLYRRYRIGRENSLSFLDFCYEKAERRRKKEVRNNGQSVRCTGIQVRDSFEA